VCTRRRRRSSGGDSSCAAPADKQWRYTRFGRGDISRVEKTADNNGSNATAKRRSPPGLEMT
jgi:hypothetical protein